MKDLADTRVDAGGIVAAKPAVASSFSLWLRAVLAILLIIGYYALSAAAIVGLLALAIASLHFGWAGAYVAAGGFIAAVALVISILPRFDRYRPPGVRLKPESQPKLFEAISTVARSMGQRMPDAVYLIPQLNAWVTERGGITGLGRRRYLVVGFPLFPLMTVSQLEGILAHDFGHYYNGDMKLSAWIYRTRNSMIRASRQITSSKLRFFAGMVYVPYVEIFVHITQPIVRYQEYKADEVAARAAGRDALIEGLQLVRVGEDAFKAYWESAVRPLLSQDARPPIMEGFRRFASNQDIVEALARKVQLRMQADKKGEYDPHPILPERIAALKLLPSDTATVESASALTLISDCDRLEQAYLDEQLKGRGAEKLKLVHWEDVLEQVYIPMWRGLVSVYAEGLAGVTPDSLPDIIKNLSRFTTIMAGKATRAQSFDTSSGWHQRASTTIEAALTLALRTAGWSLSMAPGEPVVASRNGQEIRPFEVLGRLMAGSLTPEAWREQCLSAGISGMDFGRLDAHRAAKQ